MEKYNGLAKDIIAHVGGKENITGLRHCVTRLRFDLSDEGKADDAYLKNLDGVITITKAVGQYMVVIGEHVPYVYEEVCKEIGMKSEATGDADGEMANKASIMQRVVGVVMGSMGPILNMVCACGIVKTILVVLTLAGVLTASDGIYVLINAIGDSLFFFLPIVLGYNLAQKLNMDPFLGLVIGAFLCYPSVNGGDRELFGRVVSGTYTNSFLPVIFMVCLAAPLDKKLRKIIPALVRNYLAPVIVLLTIVPFGFIFIAPLANLVGVGINTIINTLFGISPVIASVIIAGGWQLLVLHGVHGILLMFPFMELLQGNPSKIMPLISFACFAQIGVVLAVYFRTKNVKLKSIALPAFKSGIFGVTEPAIYGITQPHRKMFIISCIGAAAGGLIMGIADIAMYQYTGLGVVALLGLIDLEGVKILPFILIVAVPFLLSFAMAYVIFKDNDSLDESADTSDITAIAVEKNDVIKEVVLAPAKGQVQLLSTTKDEAFASGALGKGVVIIPAEGLIRAPFDGVVSMLFPTKHAMGIVSKYGCEVLIHIGIDTVSLDGEGFEAFVKQGDEVKAGQDLVGFDRELLLKKGFDLTTPILITNYGKYSDIIEKNHGEVDAGDALLEVTP